MDRTSTVLGYVENDSSFYLQKLANMRTKIKTKSPKRSLLISGCEKSLCFSSFGMTLQPSLTPLAAPPSRALPPGLPPVMVPIIFREGGCSKGGVGFCTLATESPPLPGGNWMYRLLRITVRSANLAHCFDR